MGDKINLLQKIIIFE